MQKRDAVKKLIHILPLITGCLFLAWVMVLLIGDVVHSYGLESNVRIIDGQKFDVFGESGSSFLGQSGNGFAHMANAFSYYYNQCGYYDNRLSYIPIQDGQVSENGLQYAFVELYLLLALLLVVSVIICKRAALCYIVSGILFVLILVVGKSPSYIHLMLLVLGWIYLNLAGNFIELKGTRNIREFWKEFPVTIFPVYGILLVLILGLSVVMPASVLPEASKDTKDVIFAKLQEIQMVSNQYEENRQRSAAETQRQQNMEDWEMGEDESENAGVAEQNPNPEDNNQGQGDDSSDENMDQMERQNPDDFTGQNGGENNTAGNEGENNTGGNFLNGNHSEGDSAVEEKTGILGSLTEMLGLGSSSGTGLGFSLRSGGGVSEGRIDRTGNLEFSGKTVLKVYSDFKPEETMYIRLFYGEDYKDNRWKQTDEEHFDDIVTSRSLAADYDGDGELDQVLSNSGALNEREVLKLTMPTFYGLSNGSLNGQSGSEFVRIEYSSRLSASQTFGGSRLASLLYPEKDSYLNNTCKAVPAELQELFAAEFSDVFNKNQRSSSKMEAANRIERLLEETAYYTLSPGNPPNNKDFITWFLMENKRGYCMHFASAGVMMLREVGISARYAEGYSVPASAWMQQEDGKWCAEVKDSNAHAWAEIYSGDSSEYGYWLPVELTPAYNGELAGSFGGQPDMYVGRFVVPGIIVKIVKMIFRVSCAVLFAIAGLTIYRKGKVWYEKRLIHTGSRKRDVKNMMKLLLKKASRKNRKVRTAMKQQNLTLETFKEQIPSLIPEFSQDAEAAVWFGQLSDYVYKAAFGAYISRQERNDALNLYRKLRCKLNRNQMKKKSGKQN